MREPLRGHALEVITHKRETIRTYQLADGRRDTGSKDRQRLARQRGAVDLFADRDDIFDALGEVLARARDSLLHALNKTWFLFFVQTAKKGLNHELSNNDYRRIERKELVIV